MKKTPKFATTEESQKIKEQINKQIEKLNEELASLREKYIEVGQSKKVNTRRLVRLEKQERRTEAKIQSLRLDLEHLEDGTYIKLNIFQKIIRRIKRMSYTEQKIVCGIILLLPWFIGFCVFFLKPLITTIYWSFNEVKPIAGGLNINFIGIKNYIDLFKTQMLGNRTFLEVLTVSIEDMASNTVIIFFFSLIVAVVLNTKFRGHQVFKAIFFIPVVYNTTVITSVLTGSFGDYASGSMSGLTGLLDNFSQYLLNLGIGEGLMSFLISAIDRIFTIVNKSGIQILIFIAGLQSIPKQLYEAAKVEGASAYECFWKITFPMLSVLFLPVLVFTIVDCFATSDLIRFMTVDSAGAKIGYGMASTIAIIYFLVNLIIIGVLFVVLRKAVVNND